MWYSSLAPKLNLVSGMEDEGDRRSRKLMSSVLPQKLYRIIGLPGGRKMIVIVRNSNPQITVNEQMTGRMKFAMQNATPTASLENFHTDPDLCDIFCALFRPQIMLTAFDVIYQRPIQRRSS